MAAGEFRTATSVIYFNPVQSTVLPLTYTDLKQPTIARKDIGGRLASVSAQEYHKILVMHICSKSPMN